MPGKATAAEARASNGVGGRKSRRRRPPPPAHAHSGRRMSHLSCSDVRPGIACREGGDGQGRSGVVIPSIPQVCLLFAIGDETQGVPGLLFVQLAEGAGPLHRTVHLVRLSRAGRTAEVAHRATRAGFDVLYAPSRDGRERRPLQNLVDVIDEEITAVELGDADELAAGEQVAARADGEEAAPASAW